MRDGCTIIIAQVDPDAIGSAVAMARLIHRIKGNGFKAKIFYAGSISHPQNRALVNRFNLASAMKHVKNFTAADNRNVVLVDSSAIADNRLSGIDKIKPLIVIDHHRGGDVVEEDNSFVWVEDVGSASTMMFEAMQALEVPIVEGESMTVALLLAVGIYTDTGSLMDCSARDRTAYNEIAGLVPNSDLIQLFRYPLPISHFVNIRNAYANMVTRDGRLVTHLGKIDGAEGDDLATIADELIRMNNVTLVIVWGIIGHDRTVRLSARSSDISSPLDVFLRDRFPAGSCGAKLTSDGRGVGGGNVNLNIDPWMTHDTEAEVIALVSKWVQTMVFRK